MSECKFCGAGLDEKSPQYLNLNYECGSSAYATDAGSKWSQGNLCKELAAYRNLLPLPQSEWGGEITPEICERLSLIKKEGPIVTSWRTPEDPQHAVVYFEKGCADVGVNGLIQDGRKHTAGQLMLLVAARRLGETK